MTPEYRKGMVAAGHKVTAEAGAEILKAGGNAVDGAVAAICAAFISEPVLTGPAGGGFLLLRDPHGRSALYDGFARMPSRHAKESDHLDFREIPVDFGNTVQGFHIGQASVATPMLMAMLFKVQEEHGRIPILEVLQPAISLARQGVVLNRLQATFLKLLEPILTSCTACRNLYAPDGKLLGNGDHFRNPDWANILEMLALDGIDEMYRGDLARAIVRACMPGGLLGEDDLAGQQVHVRKPLKLDAAGGILLTNPPPSSGGCLMAFSLHLLEAMRKRMPRTGLTILMAESMRAASRARSDGFDRQIHLAGIEDRFLSPEHFRRSLETAMHRLQHGNSGSLPEPENQHGSTTHISVVDKNGFSASLTTSNGEGSGIVVPGTGIHLNNMLGEEDINPLGFHKIPLGETLSSMMAPSIFVREGKTALVLGSGGSNRLRGAILQVFCRHILAGDDIETAVHAARIHNEDSILDCEPGAVGDAERSLLRKAGWELRDWPEKSVYFGGVHAISIDAKGQLHGAGDPRRGGSVAWA